MPEQGFGKGDQEALVAQGQHAQHRQLLPPVQSRPDPSIVDCDVPLNTMDITQDVVLRAESLPTSLEPTDFLERICALVGVRRETARLAYKWHTDTANAAPRALSTDADVHNLFDENNRRRRQWRHGQRVPKITVINLAAVPRTAAARKAAEKKRKLDEAVASGQSSDESCAAEFERCRQRLRCPHRNSDNAYCWVNPKDPMKHCQPLATWECNCGHVSCRS
ncbi:hypothetical protein FKP32DRAFT_1754243 [Trametes sanguinea]|nr:hypothetical protein FKP32DRAFT_1754243 [Trametes sanguinea]